MESSVFGKYHLRQTHFVIKYMTYQGQYQSYISLQSSVINYYHQYYSGLSVGIRQLLVISYYIIYELDRFLQSRYAWDVDIEVTHTKTKGEEQPKAFTCLNGEIEPYSTQVMKA